MTNESGGEPTSPDGNTKYWYNTKSGKVEVGEHSSWPHLMGPYPTYEAAASALENAQQRNAAWDAEDDA